MSTINNSFDEGTLYVTEFGFDTNTSVDGDESDGMLVTVTYVNGLTEVLTWETLGTSRLGGVTGTDMTMTSVSGSRFDLTATEAIASIKMEALYGNAVFDTLKGINDGTRGDTLGTRIGFPYEEIGGDPLTGTINVTFSNGVIRQGLERGDDIFTTMLIDYTGLDGGGFIGNTEFRADMDNIAVPGDLVPLVPNELPVATADVGVTSEDVAVAIDVLGNDTDLDGDVLSVASVSQGANGAVSINGDGTVQYTPDADFNGVDSFTYDVSDGNGGTDTGTVNVTIGAVNDAPVAVEDGALTDTDVAVDIDVLANDSDIDGDTLTVTSVTQGANGAVTINADGTVNYAPNAGFDGIDSFTYDVSDGNGGTATETVTVSVGSNDVPVAGADDYAVDEDTTLTVAAAAGVLANDSDDDGDVLSVSLLSDVSNGTLALNADGSFDYTPGANFNGADAFTYTVSDGFGGEDTATVSITVNAVNDAPVAGDDEVATDVDAAVDIDVLANDTDVEGDARTVTAVTQGANGAVTINGDGTVNYAPNAGFEGADSFTYDVSDGNGGTDTATVSVTVAPSGLYIVGTEQNDRLDGTEGNDTLDPLGGLRDELEGFDGADFFDLASSTTNGITEKKVILDFDAAEGDLINLGGASVASYVVRNGNLSIRLDGDGDDINLRGVSEFSEAYFFSGTPNELPVATADVGVTSEDVAVAIDVLGNDTDLDGDVLSVASVSQGANGAVSINGDGTVQYTPDADFNGVDSFTYDVSDGNGGTDTGTVNVTIGAVNDAPVAVEDGALTDTDVAVDIDVLANDSDIDGDTLTVTSVTQGANGAVTINADGTVNYAPNAGFDGIDSFTYDVSDGNGGTATETVTVSVGSNDVPVAGADDYAVDEDTTLTVAAAAGVLANDSDDDGDVLSVSLLSDVSNGTLALNADGSFDYTPGANFNGADAFTYTVSDGFGGEDTATVSITVNAVNDAPVAGDDEVATDVDAAVDIDVLANDTDVEGDARTVTAVTQGANGAVTINGDGTVNYAPNAGFEGADSFTYDVSDGNGGTDTATVSVTVAPSGLYIVGTEQNDRLDGTEGNDTLDPLGGLRDELEGFDGADFFDLASSTTNGITEKKVILDFDAAEGDLINLGGASVASYVVRNGNLSIRLDGDGDTVNLRGFSDFDLDIFA
jgi:hypothetical protein